MLDSNAPLGFIEEGTLRSMIVTREPNDNHDEVIVRFDVSVSLQQRVSIRLRSPQIQDLIDWLVDQDPNNKEL